MPLMAAILAVDATLPNIQQRNSGTRTYGRTEHNAHQIRNRKLAFLVPTQIIANNSTKPNLAIKGPKPQLVLNKAHFDRLYQ